MKITTQKQAILHYLIMGGKLTSLTATAKQFGYCTKLGARLKEFEDDGFVFKKEKVNKRTIFNEPCYYKIYSLDVKKTSKKLINQFLKGGMYGKKIK